MPPLCTRLLRLVAVRDDVLAAYYSTRSAESTGAMLAPSHLTVFDSRSVRGEIRMRARNVTSAAVVVLLLMGIGSASARAQEIEVVHLGERRRFGRGDRQQRFVHHRRRLRGGRHGTARIGSGDPLGGFPLSDEFYGILTTGDPLIAPDNTAGVVVNPAPDRGDAFDTTIVRVGLIPPAGASCLVFTYRFFTDEAVGAGNGDAFIAELDGNTWELTGTTLTGPTTSPPARGRSASRASANSPCSRTSRQARRMTPPQDS